MRTQGPREAPLQSASGSKENAKSKWKMESGIVEIMEWPISANCAITGEGIRESGPEIGIARPPKPESYPSRRHAVKVSWLGT